LNKIYGWIPKSGPLQSPGAPNISATETGRNIYVTCTGAQPADNDVLSDIKYYSLLHPRGHPSYGGIPNYFFPYRNDKGHIQPFVLVQFSSLPLNRLITVKCLAWANNIEHDPKSMRGMVVFQLFRTHEELSKKIIQSNTLA